MPTLWWRIRKNSRPFSAGFSLVEILIVIALVSFIAFLFPSMMPGERRKLESGLSALKNSVRFAQDEAILRNRIVRLRLTLKEESSEFTVESSSATDMLLENPEEERDRREQQDESQKDFERSFQPIESYNQFKKPLSPPIRIAGVLTNAMTEPGIQGEYSLYFYPNGDRDAGMVFLMSTEEAVGLMVYPFQMEFSEAYFTFQEDAPPLQQAYGFMQQKASQWMR